jgi:hypothetical protein
MDGCFRRNAQVEVAPMKSESLLFNPENNTFCVLNHTASLLWRELEQPRTLEELASGVCNAYHGVSNDVALRDVQQAIQQLVALTCVIAPSPNV